VDKFFTTTAVWERRNCEGAPQYFKRFLPADATVVVTKEDIQTYSIHPTNCRYNCPA